MTLAAFGTSAVCSDIVKIVENQQNLDDELILITEFKITELEMVVKFCMEGILPLPMSKLEKHVPVHISRVFSAFGISLEQVLFKKVDLKQENIEVKIEENTISLPIWSDHEDEAFEEIIA